MNHDDLLLIGSVPLDTAEEVFRLFGGKLGEWMPYVPDGEIGERRYWIDGLAYRVLNGHPEIETLRRPAPDKNGVEQWRPAGVHDQFQFRVRPGVDKVRFGDEGWRLGYTRDAINSYYVFRTLKKEGVLPAHLRLQVCIPLTYSAVGSYFDPADHAKIVPGFTESLCAEIKKMVEKIPPSELAIQWDLAVENRHVEATLAKDGLAAAQKEAERIMAPNREIMPYIPREVPVGYHTCFGTLNGWPSRQPKDLTGSVVLINAAATTSPGRPIDFVHIPTLGSAEDTFFKPLSDLRIGKARVYLGLIHHLNGFHVREQIQAARKYLPDFGVAAPCGFGRAPERPGRLLTDEGSTAPKDYLDELLKDHMAGVEALHEVMAR
jgi:hypothetical protein